MPANLWPEPFYSRKWWPTLWWPYKADTVAVSPSRSRVYSRELEIFKAWQRELEQLTAEKTVLKVGEDEVEIIQGSRPLVIQQPDLFIQDLKDIYPRQEAIRIASVIERRRVLKELKKSKEVIEDLLYSGSLEDELFIKLLLFSNTI